MPELELDVPIRDEARAEARATRAGAARPAEVRRAAGGMARRGACAARDIAVGDTRATRAVSRWRLCVPTRDSRKSLRGTGAANRRTHRAFERTDSCRVEKKPWSDLP